MFLAILEHGSVSAAGRRLGVSQPAVSGHLHSLEARYGVVLLERGRPVRATAAGACLERHARRIVASYREMEEEMSRQAEPSGDLTVGASTTPAEVIIPRIVAKFAGLCPEVNLKVRVGDTREIMSMLREREIELGLVGLEPEDDFFASRLIEHDLLTVIVPEGFEGDEISAEEFASRPLVLREEGSATRRAVEKSLSDSNIAARSILELGSNAAIVGAIAQGAGVGVVPKRIVSGGSGVTAVRVAGLEISRPLALVSEANRGLSPAAEEFGRLCSELA